MEHATDTHAHSPSLVVACVIALALLWLVGCSGTSEQARKSGALTTCTPGQSVSCACANLSQSTAPCLATGVPGSCQCSDGAAGISAAGGAAGVAANGGSGVAGIGSAGVGASGTGAAGDTAGASGAGGAAGTSSVPFTGTWPAADPAKKGPFATVTESNVGPGGAFTMYRPMDLAMGGLPHPVVTWGNGTGTTPPTYSFLLNQLASHGFVVIASNSMNVAQGTPPPMIQGVDWILQQNDDATSALYHHIDTMHIGATGHSQGAFAASSADTDPRMTTMAPIEGARAISGQHGPGLLICGGMDTTVPCSGAMMAFSSITDRPVMYAELSAADHMNWISASFTSATLHPFVVAVTAWMRVQLMGDQALKPMFYGPDCTMCKDSAWKIMQKML